MIFANSSFHERTVTMRNISRLSARKERILAPTKAMNSLPATEGFQLFDSNTNSLFVKNA